MAGRGSAPAEPTQEPIADWAAVNRLGERLAARVIRGHGVYRMTAASTVVLGEALVEFLAREPPRAGVFAPEQLFTLDQLGPAYARAGFEIADR